MDHTRATLDANLRGAVHMAIQQIDRNAGNGDGRLTAENINKNGCG